MQRKTTLAFAAALSTCVAGSIACQQLIQGVRRDPSAPEPQAPGAVPSATGATPVPYSSPLPPPSPSTSAPLAFATVRPEAGREWKPQWSSFVAEAIDAIGSDLVEGKLVPTADMRALCAGFASASKVDRKRFWALFFASFARYESGYDPGNRFREGASLNHVYSEGLLQLSYGDEANHPSCPLSKTKGNIADPRANLTCGVAIMKSQLRARGSVFTSSHYYWSVLTNKRAQIAADFARAKPQLGFCDKY